MILALGPDKLAAQRASFTRPVRLGNDGQPQHVLPMGLGSASPRPRSCSSRRMEANEATGKLVVLPRAATA